ncbi:hypothetical protein V5O48_009513 [Marasmius crinis-equi]|uniref:F-box domain-containing protein n=1 Tax=Marasmius crinis-equi TaxID=585013 RepID=A0ABR3FBH1_9AGAR
MPWVLTQICQSWRNYVLSTPRLWSFISIRFASAGGGPGPEGYIQLQAKNHRLRLQLRRSSTHPLTIVTRFPDNSPFASPGDRALFLMCTHAARWRDIRIELNNTCAGDLSALRGLLPMLESLYITFLEEVLNQEVTAFEVAPRLTNLILSGKHCRGSTGTTVLRLPFPQITNFSWYDETSPSIRSSVGWRAQHEILSRLQNVEKCRVSLHTLSIDAHRIDVQDNAGQPFHVVTLPKLRELELIDNRGISGIDMMFSSIQAPSLTSLTISSSGRTRNPLVNLLSFTNSLLNLSIHDVEMSPLEFGAVLLGLASLTDLSFGVGGGITNSYLGLFRETDDGIGGFSAVPKMQNLTLVEITGAVSSYSEDVLLDMLGARRRKGTTQAFKWRLLSVELGLGVVTESARARLVELRAEGLRVRLPVEELS